MPSDEAANSAVNTAHGAVQAVAINLYNPFLGIDLIRLGGGNFEVGLLSSLPPLAGVFSGLIGARWLAGQRDSRRVAALLFGAARLIIAGLAVVDLTARGAPAAAWRPALFVVLVGLAALPQSLGTLCWQAMLTGLLSPARRGPALARRIATASLVGVAVALGAGAWAAGRPGVSGYVPLFCAAAVAGVGEAAVFLRFRGGEADPQLSERRLAGFRRLWADAAFRRFSLSCLPFYLGWLMAWPLFLRYQVSVAHADNFWMGAYAATSAVAGALGNATWERVSRRLGAARALSLAVTGLALVPSSYLLRPGVAMLLVPQVLGGFMGGGVNLLLLIRLMEVAPADDRVVAMGVNSTLLGAVGVVGPLLGTALLGPLGMPHVFWVPATLRFGGGATLLAVLVAGGLHAGRAARHPPRLGRARG